MASLSQLPDVVDLSFVAGDTFKIRVRIIDPNPTPANPDGLIDLDGYKITADIKKSYTAAGAIGGFDVYLPGATTPLYDDKSPSVVIPPNTTEVILVLDPSETMGLLVSAAPANEFTGVWDLQVTFDNGDVRTVAKGAVHCYLDVTESLVLPTP